MPANSKRSPCPTGPAPTSNSTTHRYRRASLTTFPAGNHLLVLTHDRAEDLAILDMALRRDDLGFIDLIGSSAKWAHFRGRLLEQGHPEEVLARITTPIGLPEVPGKSPPAIAIAVAAQLLTLLELPEGGF